MRLLTFEVPSSQPAPANDNSGEAHRDFDWCARCGTHPALLDGVFCSEFHKSLGLNCDTCGGPVKKRARGALFTEDRHCSAKCRDRAYAGLDDVHTSETWQ